MRALLKLLLVVALFGAILAVAGSTVGTTEAWVIAALLLAGFYGAPMLLRLLRSRHRTEDRD